jgi:hypothetical protein
MATKITLRPAGATDSSTDVVLADGADRSADNVRGPAAGTINVAIGVQQFNAIRAESASFFPRGNRAGTYTFEASRRFAAMADAGRFMLTHGMTVPASGTLIFDFGDTEATPTPGKYGVLFGCVIRQVGLPRRVGVHIVTSYTVNFSSAAEVDADDLADEIETRTPKGIVQPPTIKINCGGISLKGTEWVADDNYNPGTEPGGSSAEVELADDTPAAVYATWREGSVVEYELDLPAGSYDVRLHFVEQEEEAADDRVFDIAINGVTAFEDFDIYAQVGAAKALVAGVDDVEVTDTLTITMTATTGLALICGIEVVPHAEFELPEET